MEPRHSIPECGAIDEHTIELYIMGRLEEGPVRQHLDTCDSCKDRVAEHRIYLDTLKQVLRAFKKDA